MYRQGCNTKQGCRLGPRRTACGHLGSPKPDQAAGTRPGVKWVGGRRQASKPGTRGEARAAARDAGALWALQGCPGLDRRGRCCFWWGRGWEHRKARPALRLRSDRPQPAQLVSWWPTKATVPAQKHPQASGELLGNQHPPPVRLPLAPLTAALDLLQPGPRPENAPEAATRGDFVRENMRRVGTPHHPLYDRRCQIDPGFTRQTPRTWQIKAPSLPPHLSSEIFTTRSPGKARVLLLVHRGGQCLDTCFPARSAGKLLFPTFLLQPGPRLSQRGTAPSPSQPGANALPVGRGSSTMPGFNPACFPLPWGEDRGTRPSPTLLPFRGSSRSTPMP